jgi:alanine racemase
MSNYTCCIPETHPSWVEINLAVLENNLGLAKNIIGSKMKIIPSVKGNAYGSGVVEVCKTLKKLGAYAVATGSFEDALRIRESGNDIKIHMFAGNLPAGIKVMLEKNLILTVYNEMTATEISKQAKEKTPVFIKIDAGLSRLGVPLENAFAFIKKMSTYKNLYIEGIYTHLPFNTASGFEWAKERVKEFDSLIALVKEKLDILPPVIQALASSGIITGLNSTESTTFCVGHLIFGVSSGLDGVPSVIGDLTKFKPVFESVKSKIIHIRSHDVAKQAGNNGSLSIAKDAKTAVIPVGSYDGFRPPANGQKEYVIIKGHKIPVIGFSQEFMTLDISSLEKVNIGDEVTVIGSDGNENINALDIAKLWGTNDTIVMMTLNERMPYRYNKNETV